MVIQPSRATARAFAGSLLTGRGMRLRGGSAGSALDMAMSSLSPEQPTTIKVLTYDYVPDILEKRGPYRAGHIGGAKNLEESGNLIVAGALANPVDGAVFLFKGLDDAEIQEFVKQDPYVINGLVTSWKIRDLTAVVGTGQV